MEDPLPIGLALRVPLPTGSIVAQNHNYYSNTTPAVTDETPKTFTPGPDGLCDFDDLTIGQVRIGHNRKLFPACSIFVLQMRHTIAKLINTLPSVILPLTSETVLDANFTGRRNEETS